MIIILFGKPSKGPPRREHRDGPWGSLHGEEHRRGLAPDEAVVSACGGGGHFDRARSGQRRGYTGNRSP